MIRFIFLTGIAFAAIGPTSAQSYELEHWAWFYSNPLVRTFTFVCNKASYKVEKSFSGPMRAFWLTPDGGWFELNSVHATEVSIRFSGLTQNYFSLPNFRTAFWFMDGLRRAGVNPEGYFTVDTNPKINIRVVVNFERAIEETSTESMTLRFEDVRPGQPRNPVDLIAPAMPQPSVPCK